MAREITYNNFEIWLVVFTPNITSNHAITYTNEKLKKSQILTKTMDKTPFGKIQILSLLNQCYSQNSFEKKLQLKLNVQRSTTTAAETTNCLIKLK